MDDKTMGPPEKGRPDASQVAGPPIQESAEATTNASQHIRSDDLAARGRRRGTALRSTVISTCSCIRDPETDRHRCGGAITDKQVGAAVAAAAHLEHLGTPGLFDIDTTRALWRRGHRRLALDCATRAGWTAA
jgi:hypothetical protein